MNIIAEMSARANAATIIFLPIYKDVVWEDISALSIIWYCTDALNNAIGMEDEAFIWYLTIYLVFD